MSDKKAIAKVEVKKSNQTFSGIGSFAQANPLGKTLADEESWYWDELTQSLKTRDGSVIDEAKVKESK